MKHIYNVLLVLLFGAILVGCNKKNDTPKPTVSMVQEEGFTTGDKHLFKGSTLKFGFDAVCNASTMEKLVRFHMFISNGQKNIYDTTFLLDNVTDFHCEGEFTFDQLGSWQIAGYVYDVSGEEGREYIDIHVVEDMETSFVWKQYGENNVEGFEDYGLLWDDRVVDTVTIMNDTISLLPANDSISLYLFDASKWDEIENYNDKENLFKDIVKNPKNYKNNKIDAYKGIIANQENVVYDEVIAVLNETEQGENLILYISNSFSEEYHGERHLTVNGKLK